MTAGDELERRLERTSAVAQAEQRSLTVEQAAAHEAAASRGFITRTVIGVWAMSLLVWAIAAFGGSDREALASLTDLIKTAVLPLTTLVLGYYLSRSR